MDTSHAGPIAIEPGVAMNRLLNSDEVCAILGIRRLLLYALIHRGELKSVRVGRQHRFIPSDIATYIANGGAAGAQR